MIRYPCINTVTFWAQGREANFGVRDFKNKSVLLHEFIQQ